MRRATLTPTPCSSYNTVTLLTGDPKLLANPYALHLEKLLRQKTQLTNQLL